MHRDPETSMKSKTLHVNVVRCHPMKMMTNCDVLAIQTESFDFFYTNMTQASPTAGCIQTFTDHWQCPFGDTPYTVTTRFNQAEHLKPLILVLVD